MTKKAPKIGFDLDGVLLYNPARIMRFPIVTFKRMFIPKREKKFLIPKNIISRQLWSLAHLSSFVIAKGFDDLQKIVLKHHLETYIITARFDFLKNNSLYWFDRLNKNKIFQQCYINHKNQQPHLYKEKLVKKLDLDIFIDDNWDIVNYLSKKTDAKIYWIYNIFDRYISYPFKYPNLKSAIEQIKKEL